MTGDRAVPTTATEEAPAVVGVDIGGTKCLGILVDAAGRRIGEERIETPEGQAELVDALEALVRTLAAQTPAPVAAAGFGIAGLVTRQGTVRFSPNLPGVTELRLGPELARRLGIVVTVDNDATSAMEAEWRLGAARGVDDAVLVTLGTGIGGGVVAGGVLQRGVNGFAGEPGHMVVVPDGVPCPCGRRGCWERYASGSALGRLAREAVEAGRLPSVLAAAGGDVEAVRGEHVTDAAAAGDAAALAVLDRLGWWIAFGLANLANLYDPALFVVAGGLAEEESLLLEPVRRHFATLLFAREHRPVPAIVAATMGPDAGAIGAALVAREALGSTLDVSVSDVIDAG